MASSVTELQHTAVLQHDVTEQTLSAAAKEFTALLGPSALITDPDQCHARSNMPWSPAAAQQRPALVLLPQTTADVSAIMRICSTRKIPVFGYSGGTSLPGSLIATRGGVCIDFKLMNKVIAVNEEDMDTVVQPGLGWKDLNTALEAKGLFFPPDPSPDARIGGMIAMSCSGTSTYRYGTMKEWVIALTVVLADGLVVKTRRRPRKSSAGYDLTRLIIGSEGTLGLVTEAVLKVTPVPINTHVAIVTFPDLYAATRTGLSLVRSGRLIDALELLDDSSMHAINISKLSPKHWDERPTLFIKLSGAQNVVDDHIAAAQEAALQNQCIAFNVSRDPETINTWWDARKNTGKSLLALKKSASDVFIPSDAAVPVSRLADLMVASQRFLREAGMKGSVVGHLGDGNIHVVIVCDADEKDRGYRVINEVQKLALEMEGTITGEHGVGLSLRDMLVNEVGENAVNLMRRIKLALDPSCILNCDKVIRMEPSDP